MTIQLTRATRIAGTVTAAGTQLTLTEALEADLIYQGIATRVGAAPNQSGKVPLYGETNPFTGGLSFPGISSLNTIVQRPKSRASAPSVLGGTCTSVAVGAMAKSVRAIWSADAEVIGVRIHVMNGSPTGTLTVGPCCVAPTAHIDNLYSPTGGDGAWVALRFDSGANTSKAIPASPAASGGGHRNPDISFVTSDWADITSVTPVPGSNNYNPALKPLFIFGADFLTSGWPVANDAAYVGQPGANWTYPGSTTGPGCEYGKVWHSRYDYDAAAKSTGRNNAGVTTANWGANGGAVADFPGSVFWPEFLYANAQVVSVGACGDSTVTGTSDGLSNDSFLSHACYTATGGGLVFVPFNTAWSGSAFAVKPDYSIYTTSKNLFRNISVPDVLLIQTYTPNSSISTEAANNSNWGAAMDMVSWCYQNHVVPILLTPVPTPTVASAVNTWRVIQRARCLSMRDKGILVLDQQSILEDPASPNQFAAGMHKGDNVHPSATAHRLIGKALAPILSALYS
jgi:hypothetical protein